MRGVAAETVPLRRPVPSPTNWGKCGLVYHRNDKSLNDNLRIRDSYVHNGGMADQFLETSFSEG